MKVLIAGSGKMGSDIFYYLLDHSLEITWLCLDEDQKQQAESTFQKKINRQLRSGIISNDEYNDLIDHIKITSDISLAKDTDLVIEAIWEATETKQKFFFKLDEVLSPSAIITTNTSSIPIRKLIPSEKRKPFFAGLHFFFPVKLHNIVEINAPLFIDDSILQQITEFLNSIELRSILLSEGHHFLLNRLLLPVQNEAYNILKEGKMTAEEIDSIVKTKLFTAGIFEFFDHVGIDIMQVSVKNYAENFPSGINYSGMISYFQNMMNDGKLGVKSGQGFYQYPRLQSHAEINTKDFTEESNRLERTFFETINRIFGDNTYIKKELEYAINEYLNVDIIAKAKNAGYNF
jgi:3-hydroxyacyl-CoA dehydrogenase